MKGSEERLVRYMEGSKKRFVIPVYQRNYDWKIEHCKQLYDDLVKIVTQKRKSHFFGSIVSVFNPDGHQDEFLIIDGQQRITTISLLFLAMYNLIKDGVIVPKSSHLGQQLYEDYLVDKWQPQETRIKLKPIKNDQLAFGRLFDKENEAIADSNLTINYEYFFNRIQNQEIKVDDLFDAVSKLEIISISLNQDDNAQLIFESLNSTGLDLSEGDKIRNFILMGLPSKQQEQYYEKYWNKIERCTDYDVSSFVRDYLSVKQQSTPAIRNVYFKFKEYVEGGKFTLEELLYDLLLYAIKYEYLIKANTPWQRVNECIYRLNRIKTTVTRPFLMEVFRLKEQNKLTESELYTIFSIIENYIFRRNICEIATNALNKIFLMLHREIERLDEGEDNYLEKFKYVLLNKKESGRFPDDEEFLEALASKNVYGMRGESKLYLFERLENAGTAETKDVWEHFDKNEYSIEHIMPQRLSPAWISDLGEDSERIHSVWLHRLANLTLTAYNSKYSNHSFIDKRDMEYGFKQSGLRLNQWICQKDKWGEAELEERNELLMARAVQIWPQIETDYEPRQILVDAVTLDEEMVFTSKSISKFSFMGVEQVAESWIDMYQSVLTELHTKDKSILTKLAICDDASVELATHFSTAASAYASCRRIDHHVYVWTGTDTQYKINVLKKVFSLFDVDPTELVFYLRDETKNAVADVGRHLIRRKYWAYTLPMLREKTTTFSNVNPSKENWINGYLGYHGVHVTCVANFDSVRVELNLEMASKQRNKELFDFLYSRKEAIEAIAGRAFIWDKKEDTKSSKIYLSLSEVNISDEADWERMAQFHVEGCSVMIDAFREALALFFG